MKTARLMRVMDRNEVGALWHLYKMDPPLEGAAWVVVSAADVMFSGPETYIFPADEDGHITDWFELDGSYRGGLDHEHALALAGYTVAQ